MKSHQNNVVDELWRLHMMLCSHMQFLVQSWRLIHILAQPKQTISVAKLLQNRAYITNSKYIFTLINSLDHKMKENKKRKGERRDMKLNNHLKRES